MPNKKLNAAILWKHFEDVLVPALCLSHIDRAVYSLLLRHTLLEGRPRLRVSMNWLARAVRLTSTTARRAIRRLVSKGVLRLVERTRDGHLVELLDPNLIRPASGLDVAALSGPAVIPRRCAGTPRMPQLAPHRAAASGASTARSLVPNLSLRGTGALRSGFPKLASAADSTSPNRGLSRSANIETVDFLATASLREAIYKRDRHRCFYCFRRLTPRARCLDHVLPQLRSGGNSFCNLVACCLECNSHKRAKPAADHLRSLYREDRLTAAEFNARLQALRAMASGQLRPTLPDTSTN